MTIKRPLPKEFVVATVVVATLIAAGFVMSQFGGGLWLEIFGAAEQGVEQEEERILGGIHYQPPRQAPDFQALNHFGEDYKFHSQPHPIQLVFFGYVSCLDVCPTNLKRFELMYEALGKDADQVQFVFVSVDPEWEDPQIMAEYLEHYQAEIVGVTGSLEQLTPVYEAWDIWREYVELDEPVMGRDYRYDHTGQIFLVQGDMLRVGYPYGTSHVEMTRDIQALLEDPSIGERLPAIGEIREVRLPPGAYSRRFQKNPTIPTYIRLNVGDTLTWKNDDYMYHFVGDLRIAPGEEATQTFTSPGEYYFGCTATPDDTVRIVVREAV